MPLRVALQGASNDPAPRPGKPTISSTEPALRRMTTPNLRGPGYYTDPQRKPPWLPSSNPGQTPDPALGNGMLKALHELIESARPSTSLSFEATPRPRWSTAKRPSGDDKRFEQPVLRQAGSSTTPALEDIDLRQPPRGAGQGVDSCN